MRGGGQAIIGRSALGAMLVAAALLALLLGLPDFARPADAAGAQVAGRTYVGVASCAGSTCHGRMEADGKVVRQDELKLWQEPSTAGGAHSRAFAALGSTRGRQIAATLGLGEASAAPACLGCHSTPAGARGPRFLAQDGVGCEGCHGAASGWIASHYAVGASHAANVAAGMTALDRPQVRAGVCLDCHFGSARPGQFVDHRMMAAGHPRVSFELDLFSTMQAHHNEDADYARRKGRTDSLKLWAVGQASAVERALTLYSSAKGSEGVFPEFYFFDCQSCHRRIYDSAGRSKTWEANPGRPIPAGMPPFNDENMIMLSAAARVIAPGLAGRFDGDSRAFHAALAKDRPAALAAATRLAGSARALADAFDAATTSGDMAFTVIAEVAGGAIAPRFTDYEGSVQAVMAVDTLLNSLVKSGRITIGAAAGIRADVNRAYAAVREPNAYRPADFRVALGSAARSIGALR